MPDPLLLVATAAALAIGALAGWYGRSGSAAASASGGNGHCNWPSTKPGQTRSPNSGIAAL